ncbi:MAG TPA: glutamate decarboxylase [Candidatus Poseidoniaceae archaeon]|nr:MAG TPA: glutamate decarboxylase [Candidatus Poseidoniales archaeon]HII45134.1 glutamate decarboxylase [Candidatus Poseidoniaceae archaeon]|tara:strand:+ start:3082 stop:4506 length:1425 start_codon:yes stop_codon:yes gene_type:complete
MRGTELAQFLDELVERIESYINSSATNDTKTIHYMSATSRQRSTDLSLPLEGNGSQSILDDVDEFLRQCVKTNRPEFMNPLWGGLNIAGFVGEVIAALTNQSMYTYELSPIATLIEKAIIERMMEIVGYGEGFGTLTTGGSNGNMLGMLCARQQLDPMSSLQGFDGLNHVAFVSAEAHYSVLMSANVLGIGYQNLIKVACDSRGRMKPESLVDEITRATTNGQTPFCIIATSGTTVRGSFDPLKDIAEIAHDNNIWLHVDAAWGGSCLFSKRHRGLMDGIELADSVCWDAHKMMGLPLICSVFLTKNKATLRAVCAHGDAAHYLFHEDSKDIDLGRYSLQCGRRNDSLKLWIAWREIGDAGWAKLVERYCKLSDYLESLVTESESLAMMSERNWTNICFRYEADDVDLNELNTEIRNRLMREGIHLVSRSNIGDDVVIRAVVANPLIDESVLKALISAIERHGKEIVKQIPAQY